MVEITQRTFQRRFFLKPSAEVNDLVVGCLAKAQKLTAAQVHAVAVLSDHFHLLASFETVEQMATFMCHLKSNLTKELNKLYDREGTMWASRYKSIPVSDEPEAQIARLRYLLSQGCKEGLVASPLEWPGVHSATALLEDHLLRGVWIDRTRFQRLRQKNQSVTLADVTSEEALHLSPLPCWEEMEPEQVSREIAEIVEDLEQETLHMHERNGTTPVGPEAVCQRRPSDTPAQTKDSPQPLFHAASQSIRDLLIKAYREFTIAYRRAAERLAEGDPAAQFPENCYPPRLPFVPPLSYSL